MFADLSTTVPVTVTSSPEDCCAKIELEKVSMLIKATRRFLVITLILCVWLPKCRDVKSIRVKIVLKEKRPQNCGLLKFNML